MSKLESNKYLKRVRKKIQQEGTTEEKEIDKLGRNILNLLDKLYPGEKYKERWSSFDVLKTAFKNNLQRYKGIYSPYFQKMLTDINEQERQAAGYHVHSN